jgi:pimeloyl-ACP methyl ester carboxylesterase
MMQKQYLVTVLMVVLPLVLFSSCNKEQNMQWESDYVVANDIKMHYTRTGLNDRFDFLMLDARGHGLSEAPSWGYDLTMYVEDLVGVIEKLDIKKPILLGHSLGAITVTMAVSRYPDLARAIILEDPVGLDYREDVPDSSFIAEKRSEILQRNQMTQEQLIALCRTQVHPNWPDSRDMIPWAQAKQQVSPEVAVLFGQIGGLVDYFSDIKCPVLILKADVDAEQRAAQKILFDKIPAYQLYYITGAGHNIRREQFENYIQLIEQFLSHL